MASRPFLGLILVCFVLISCASGSVVGMIADIPPQARGQTLTIFAAASLTETYTEIATSFERENPGTTILLNFAGSQQLAQQLAQGAPADIFASANQKQMQAVVETGRIQQHAGAAPKIFAANRLAIIYPQDNPAQLNSLSDLSKAGLKLVIADSAVPAGYYTQIFFENIQHDGSFGPGFKTNILKNVVSYENSVRAVLSKVILGEADAGIVYASDISANKQHPIDQLSIPEHLNISASYYIMPLSDSPHKQSAQAFVDYVLSPRGQAILTKYGFLPAQ